MCGVKVCIVTKFKDRVKSFDFGRVNGSEVAKEVLRSTAGRVVACLFGWILDAGGGVVGEGIISRC